MNREQSIGERDLEFYLMCVEGEKTSLRRCYVEDEPYFKSRIVAAQAVVDAIRAYNAL